MKGVSGLYLESSFRRRAHALRCKKGGGDFGHGRGTEEHRKG